MPWFAVYAGVGWWLLAQRAVVGPDALALFVLGAGVAHAVATTILALTEGDMLLLGSSVVLGAAFVAVAVQVRRTRRRGVTADGSWL